MGLGTVKSNSSVFLSIAGGYIWNKRADSNDPNFSEQSFDRPDGTTGIRKGAMYANLTGNVTGITFPSHKDYGDSINVAIDADGEKYIISVSLNNRYSQDLMKALLLMDLTRPIFIKPYDFKDKDDKRVQGIYFKQDGEKLLLRVQDAPFKEGDWFKKAKKKEIKRFFEDLTDWYQAKIEEEIIPTLIHTKESKEEKTKEVDYPSEEEKVEERVEAKKVKKVTPKKKAELTPLKKRNFIKAYIAENYEDQTIPTLSKDEINEWYLLAKNSEELPFEDDAEVSADDLDELLED